MDIFSFMEVWKGQTFRSIDSFTLSSTVKIRKIFTMKAPIFEINDDDENLDLKNQNPLCQDIPKNFNFPAGLPFSNVLITLESCEIYVGEKEGI